MERVRQRDGEKVAGLQTPYLLQNTSFNLMYTNLEDLNVSIQVSRSSSEEKRRSS